MAEEETITFDLIRKIQREEQRSPKLSKLPAVFYKSVRSYLDRKRNVSNRKTALEVKNVERLVEDIFNRRERKIFNLALIAARTNIPPENLTDEEREFFDQIVYVVKQRRGTLLGPLLLREPAEQTDLVMFKDDVQAFVGADMKNYGPFNKGDIAKLPDENKKVLLKRGVVEEFKISK
jgi:DNA replication initiation complex subunit (GINS family)